MGRSLGSISLSLTRRFLAGTSSLPGSPISRYTEPSTPLTNLPLDSPPNILASSMASLIATLAGTSFVSPKRSSKSPRRRTLRSTMEIWSIGQSGANFSITVSSFSRYSTTPAARDFVKRASSKPGANSAIFTSIEAASPP